MNFTEFIVENLRRFNAPEKSVVYYVKYKTLFNYAVVGGVGYIVNTAVLYLLVGSLPLWLANAVAVLVAFMCNWTFSVGPLGYLMDLGGAKSE